MQARVGVFLYEKHYGYMVTVAFIWGIKYERK